MSILIKILISWNVFALYFSKNFLNGSNFTDSQNYNFSNSLLLIITASQILFITNYFNLGYWKAWFLFVTLSQILLGFVYKTKIKQGVAKFKELGFSQFFFLFIIYFVSGIAFLLWMLFSTKNYFKN